MSHTPAFQRYIGLDYSGAETPLYSLKGLRVYAATAVAAPQEILPPPGQKKYWTRRGIAAWLAEILRADVPTLVGIDHGFSFPLRYFEVHHLLPDWPAFLEDFQQHWPTDDDHMYVDFIRDGDCGNAAERSGSARWRRIAEQRCGAKSVFHFDVQGSVAKSTHAGLPWLLYLRRCLENRIHFWPFDGWSIPAGMSALAEAYPSLYKTAYAQPGLTADQQDAYAIAAWLQDADRSGRLDAFLTPELLPGQRAEAQIEGWILGVT